jgi:4-diphosphocytidyl-2-C-methyl-D-erythritol kinase
MKEHVAMLGSDCVFFIENKPVLATGRGDVTEPIDMDLSSYFISIIYPEILISTPFAYSLVKANNSGESLKSIIAKKKIGEWEGYVVNDFEKPIIEKFPAIAAIKDTLYKNGAIYASMSGSGSAVYGIFDRPMELKEQFPHYKIWSGDLKFPK